MDLFQGFMTPSTTNDRQHIQNEAQVADDSVTTAVFVKVVDLFEASLF